MKTKKLPQPDFLFEDQGSIVVIWPLSRRASDWIEKNVQSEPWQWQGEALCVYFRMALGLMDTILAEGFSVKCS
jgi:hypothetical protein